MPSPSVPPGNQSRFGFVPASPPIRSLCNARRPIPPQNRTFRPQLIFQLRCAVEFRYDLRVSRESLSAPVLPPVCRAGPAGGEAPRFSRLRRTEHGPVRSR
jgi:hypothetical protein